MIAPVDDVAAQYRTVRLRLRELVGGLGDQHLDREVPAIPGWRVRDVVAHLVGVATDIATGNVGDGPSASHVERRAGRPFHEVLHEWDDAGAVLEKLLAAGPPDLAARALSDLTTCDRHLRTALGETA